MEPSTFTRILSAPAPTTAKATPSRPSPYTAADNYYGEQLGTEVVTLEVGTGTTKRSYMVHKDLLCKKAEYFHKMFNGSFSESTSNIGSFPEDDPVAFKLFISWLYRGAVEMPLSSTSTSSTGKCEVLQLFLLFVFAEKFGIAVLADETMDFITGVLKERNWFPGSDVLTSAYQNTHSGSKLWLFASRCFAFLISHYANNTSGGCWSNAKLSAGLKGHEDILLDVLAVLRWQAGKLQIDPRDQLACDYHQHANTDPCTYAKK